MALVLPLWLAIGGFLLLVALWSLGGRESLVLAPGELIHEHRIFGLSRSRRYEIAQVRNLRAVDEAWLFTSRYQGGISLGYVGALAFDYEHRTVTVGEAVSVTAAAELVDRIKRHYSDAHPADCGA